MFETMLSFVLGDHLGGKVFDPPLDAGGYGRLLSPDRRPYRTRDGFVCTMIYNDRQWRSFCAAVGWPDLVATDPRFASHATRTRHIDSVLGMLAAEFLTRGTAEWLALLEAQAPGRGLAARIRPLLANAQPTPRGWADLLTTAGIRFRLRPDQTPELL